MAKMYYTMEEAMGKLGCTEEQLRGLVRSGQLREFRDAGKANYRVDDVDKLASQTGDNIALEDSGELKLDDGSGELSLADDTDKKDASGSGSGIAAADSGSAAGLSGTDLILEGSDAPIDLGGSDTGALSLEGSSGELSLEDSGAEPAPPKGKKPREGEDVLTLDEVDKNVVEGMKKDDTVITNIGISVFDDEDLEISADPMAKTVMSGEGEGLGLDGSSAGSGLLDLTRESDDTSLGAELLEGIDMGDTGETVMKTVSDQGSSAAAPAPTEEEGLAEAEMAPVMAGPGSLMVATVQAAPPAYTGLLIAGTACMALTAAAAIAMTMQAWPAYLGALADQFWILLAGVAVVGGLGAGIGYLIGRPPAPPKAKKEKGKKGKKGAQPVAPETPAELDEGEPLS